MNLIHIAYTSKGTNTVNLFEIKIQRMRPHSDLTIFLEQMGIS